MGSDFENRQDSQKTLTFQDVQPSEGTPHIALKPRRRTIDTAADQGLDFLIQKTMSIGLQPGEDPLGPNENGNEWIESLSYHGEKLLWGVRKIRKYVCGEGSDAHAQELIQYGVMDRLMYFLDESTEGDVLFEVLWIITNIAAGPTENTTVLVDKGFLLPLGKLLTHPFGTIRTQSAWAIGNIIGDREGYRDLVLEAGFLPYILNIWKGAGLDEASTRESFRISLWIVDNMCRYRPDWHLMKPALEILPQVLLQDDTVLLKECCWAFARILHQAGRHSDIESMITPVLCSRFVEILRWNQLYTTHPVLRALINLSSSKNQRHLDDLDRAGIIGELENYLQTASREGPRFDTFAVQILGNMFLHHRFASKLSLHFELSKYFVELLASTKDRELRTEVGITIRNLLSHKDPIISSHLYFVNLLPALLRMCFRVATVGGKTQLTCLESMLFLTETADLRIASPLNSPVGLEHIEEGMYDYPSQLRSSKVFEQLLNTYLHLSGRALGDIDEPVESEASLESDSDYIDDDCNQAKVAFNTQNCHKVQQNSLTSKEQVCAILLKLLKTVFSEQFEQEVKKSQVDHAMSSAINEMGFGGKSSKISSLADSFGKLAYHTQTN